MKLASLDLKKRSTLTILLLLLLSFLNQGLSTDQAINDKQKGMTLTSWQAEELLSPDADLALSQIRATGSDWVSIVITQYQDNIHATEIGPTANTPTDEAIEHAIQTAHALGFKVMLKPHVDLSNDPAHWRAEIGTSFTPDQWRQWFNAYHAMIMHYARLAQKHEVAQFSVGTELQKASPHASFWRSLVYDIRQIYQGSLTYSANHSGEEFFLSWWDALDYIGIDAYYPLSVRSNPSLAEMEMAWRQFLLPLRGLYDTWRKPILFTELGYRSVDGAAQRPYEYRTGGPTNMDEQALAYQAFFSQVYWQPWFAGVYWWAWDPKPFTSGQCGTDYTPYDKPAEDVLRAGYGVLPRISLLPTLQPNEKNAYSVYREYLSEDWQDISWAALEPGNPALDTSSAALFSGDSALQIVAQPGEALALHVKQSSFDARLFAWLEVHVHANNLGDWRLRLVDKNAQSPRALPISDCRYIVDTGPGEQTWTRIRIPLDSLLADDRQITGIILTNVSGSRATLWLDQILFVPNW